MLTDELRRELRDYLSEYDGPERKLMLRQLLHERPDLREACGLEVAPPAQTSNKRSRCKAGQSRTLTAAGYVGDGRNMRQGSSGSGGVAYPWLSSNRGRIEPVTMTLTEATRRFPEAYGAAWMYPEVS